MQGGPRQACSQPPGPSGRGERRAARRRDLFDAAARIPADTIEGDGDEDHEGCGRRGRTR
jgi:hypothetical protein